MPGRQSSRGGSSRHVLRSYITFAALGSINIILPNIILSSSHFIIPFPYSTVLLIQLIPNILTKLTLPYVLHRIWPIARPIILTLLWILVNSLTVVQPQNVELEARVPVNILAAILGASGEVISLGLTTNHGSTGISGWGMGSGFGALACAAGPYIWTYSWGHQLRDSLNYSWYLIAILPLALYVAGLSSKEEKGSSSKSRRRHQSIPSNDDIEMMGQAEETEGSLLGAASQKQVPPSAALVRPYILPLLVASALSAFLWPGISRASGFSLGSYRDFSGFSAAYGSAFHAGNWLARCSHPFKHMDLLRPTLIRLAVLTAILLVNTYFRFVTLPLASFILLFLAGVSAGSVYINVFGGVSRDEALMRSRKRVVALGVVGVGEGVGLLLGGILGFFAEKIMCHLGFDEGLRWCHALGALGA